MQKQQSQASSSTLYRFNQCGRSGQLEQFVKFKSEYENKFSNSKISELKQVYPHGILGRNDDSCVVVIDRVGIIKSNEISKYIEEEMLFPYTMQRLLFLSEQVLHQKETVIWIIDLAGKIMQLASKKVYALLQKIVVNAQKYFPGLLHKLYFINTPMLFDAVWTNISKSVDQETLIKIVHLSDDLSELMLDVSLPLLPEYLGGSQSDQILQKIDQKAQNTQNDRNQARSQGSNEQPQIDYSSLKMALSGLKLGGSQNKSVAQTPLNTEADDGK